MSSRAIVAVMVLLITAGDRLMSAEATDQALQRQFAETVQPFVQTYCFACHGKAKQESELDLSVYATMAEVAKDHRRWAIVLERLEAEEMPPVEAQRHPTPQERQAVIDWVRALRERDAQRNAGDPGPVLARRLSNAEYDYTIRDLTGVDIRPTREFPVDPANEAGFDNSGESLAMSPALLKKYLAAARLVADHVVLRPHGFVFAPHPAVTDTDRDKYCVQRIIDFYNAQRTDLADFFVAVWRFRHRAILGKPDATLASFAAEEGISAKYLATIWSALEETKHESGPLADVRDMWQRLPVPEEAQPDIARQQCEQMRDFVIQTRGQLRPKIENLTSPKIAEGSQPLVLWKNRQYAAARMRYSAEGATERDVAPFQRFCEVFPDAFFVSERGRVFLEPKQQNKGRLLSAGFHLMMGYFRDDGPLHELILDDQERRELDSLWQELNFITLAPVRQYKDFIFFERAEPPRFMQEAKFDFARSEDKDAASEAKIERLAELYLAKVRQVGGQGEAIQAIEDYFETISAEIRCVEQARAAAEPSHLEALLALAERAYRRPLSQPERDELLNFYDSLRNRDGLGHEEAIRDSVASVLLSPQFCYRIDLPPPGDAPQPLSDYALASRLSYFLWSSMPDTELLRHAAAGDLHRPQVLADQTRRMLRDERICGLATEFGGNWLDFRRFEEHNSVDRERFQSFTNELRAAMYEEPIRFLVDVAQENRSVLDLLYAEHTFVNPVLAKHYGIPEYRERGPRTDDWVRLDDAHRYGRGGLLPMSVFLTKNAPGLRTSPVKRGYWVVRRLLGETIPPPPPLVPELPQDEAKTGDLTLRQLLASHRNNQSCAGCHERFDSVGLAFEGYGPIGERRERDLGGRPVEARAVFPGGGEGEGLTGLQDYLREHREQDFIDNLCRKLLAYALGRGLMLSDERLVGEVRAKLSADDFRIGSLVECIVTSPQFRNRRGRDYDAAK